MFISLYHDGNLTTPPLPYNLFTGHSEEDANVVTHLKLLVVEYCKRSYKFTLVLVI